MSARGKGHGLGDPLFCNSVAKAMAILESFNRERRSLNLGEIARIAGMTKSSAQRCTHTLERLGYITREPRLRGWVLTPRALQLGHAYIATHELLERMTPLLANLSRSSGQVVSLWEADGPDMVRVTCLAGPLAVPVQTAIGGRAPMCHSAVGRAHLLGLPQQEVQRIVQTQSPAECLRDEAAARLFRRLRVERTQGYARSDGHSEPDGFVLAAPVVRDDHRSAAVIEIAALAAREATDHLCSTLSPLLLEAAYVASESSRASPRMTMRF